MIVVADTSPLNYLILIDKIEILPKLFGALVVPRAVHTELLAATAPARIRDWASTPPGWVEIRTAAPSHDARLDELDQGEREAILIFEEIGADQLLMDDLPGRGVAAKRNIQALGTLGVLKAASRKGMLDLRATIDRLRRTNFFLTDDLIAKVLRDP